MNIDPFPADAAGAVRIPDAARRLWAARARSLLRRVLGLRLGLPPREIVLQEAEGKKPRVKGCEFSISHSGPWLVVATGDVALGVDIEAKVPRRDGADLAARFFSEADTAALRQFQFRPRAFLNQWVAKEAALKAAGIGLAGGLEKARCVFDAEAIREVTWDSERFSIREFVLNDGTPGALAWRQGQAATVRWRDSADLGVS